MTNELDKITSIILKDQQRFNKMLTNAAKIGRALDRQTTSTKQAIEKLNRQMAPLFSATNKISQQMASYSKIANNIDASFAPIRSEALRFQNHLNLISTSLNTKLFHAPDLVGLASRACAIAKMVDALQPRTIAELYANTVELYSETESSDPIQVTITQIEEKAKGPNTVLSLEFYLAFILSIMLFVLAQCSSNESDERLFERLDRLESTLLQSHRAAVQREADATFYVVKRSVNLRNGPSTKHSVLDVLFPNQKVKLISRNSKWIEVEYYNHIDDSYNQGWVNKKYLKILNRRKPVKYKRP